MLNPPLKLSKSQKKKINRKKKNQPNISHLDHRVSNLAQHEVQSFTQSMRIVHPVEHENKVFESSSEILIEGDRNIDAEAEPIDYTAEIITSIDILQNAMKSVLEDMEYFQNRNTELASSDGHHSKDFPTATHEIPSIIIGNMVCSPVLEESVDNITGEDQATCDRDSCDLSSSHTIRLSLAMQFTGLLHKVLLACHALVTEKLDVIPEYDRRKRSYSFDTHNSDSNLCRNLGSMTEGSNFSRVSESINFLFRVLAPYCVEWIKLTNGLKLERAHLDLKSKSELFVVVFRSHSAAASFQRESTKKRVLQANWMARQILLLLLFHYFCKRKIMTCRIFSAWTAQYLLLYL